MKRVQLFYKDISEIVGGNGFSVVRLTDKEQLRVISVICDKAMTEQITIRCLRTPGCEQMLPEVLASMLMKDCKSDMELMVYDVVDGQYRVSLLNKRILMLKTIRMSDAVLLHLITGIPLYMEDDLMQRQSSPFSPESYGIAIPINTIDTERLNKELQRAIEEEDYRLASFLHQEIKRRGKS
jgi:bifunctional DNase/RNase